MKRNLLLLVTLFAGCAQLTPQPSATLGELELARAWAAMVTATADSTPTPTPPVPPDPVPGQTCQKCDGTGIWKPDNRIEVTCPDCGGDGKTTVNESPQPALPPFNLVANKGCGCGCPDCTGKPDCPCSCPNCCCRKPDAAVFAVDWCQTIDELRSEVLKTKRPGILHVYMDGCPPCERMERDVFTNQEVVLLLNDSVVAAKVNVKNIPRERRQQWGLTQFPVDFVITADWSLRHELNLAVKPDAYLKQLKWGLKWAESKKKQRSLLRKVVEQPVVRYSEPVVYYSEPVYYGGGCSSGACGGGFYGGGYYGGGCSGGGCSGGGCCGF